MASNFSIYCHQNKDNLHLELMGDFDGTSAYELINILKKYRGIAQRVFIHTCFLSSVHSFGVDVFQKNYTIKKLSRILTFTGEYGNKLAPHGSILLKPNPDRLEPKKIGFIFTTKITKEKKDKIYNLRALRVLRGVIKLFLPQKVRNLQLRN